MSDAATGPSCGDTCEDGVGFVAAQSSRVAGAAPRFPCPDLPASFAIGEVGGSRSAAGTLRGPSIRRNRLGRCTAIRSSKCAVIGAESRKQREIMCTGEDVDAVDLQEPKPGDHPAHSSRHLRLPLRFRPLNPWAVSAMRRASVREISGCREFLHGRSFDTKWILRIDFFFRDEKYFQVICRMADGPFVYIFGNR